MRYYQSYGHTIHFIGQTKNTFKIIKINKYSNFSASQEISLIRKTKTNKSWSQAGTDDAERDEKHRPRARRTSYLDSRRRPSEGPVPYLPSHDGWATLLTRNWTYQRHQHVGEVVEVVHALLPADREHNGWHARRFARRLRQDGLFDVCARSCALTARSSTRGAPTG
jgi:hypothetical protein